MQTVTLFKYWSFGTRVRYLQDATAGLGVHGPGLVLPNMERLMTELKELNLLVTIRAATAFEELLKELKATPADSKLTPTQATKLKKNVTDLRHTLEAELKGFNAYVISPKRLDVEKLVRNVPSLFAPKEFDNLSAIAKFDLEEAGKCIAFERPTAAAFHLMRATEEVLRCYYCHFVRRDRMDPMLWYPIVQCLQKHRRAKVNDTLHKNLDNIRLSFRNPTQHPDKVYDIQEAQDLWGLCVDVIGRMQRAMSADPN